LKYIFLDIVLLKYLYVVSMSTWNS